MKTWRDQILMERVGSIDAEINERRTVGCKNKDKWQKIG
jgi:hypothetical protein